MNREEAKEAVGLLRKAQDTLTEYRVFLTERANWRPVMSDLAMLDYIDGYNDSNDDTQLTLAPDDVMVELLVLGEGANISDENGYVWEAFDEEAGDVLAKNGLSMEPVQDTLPLDGA